MRIKAFATGIDKVIYTGALKDVSKQRSDDRRVVGIKRLNINGGDTKTLSKAATVQYGEFEENVQVRTLPFFNKLIKYKHNNQIKSTFKYNNKRKKGFRFGKLSYEQKYVLTRSFGEFYTPYTKDIFAHLPVRYEFNPNKAMRNIDAFLPFFNEFVATMQDLIISEMHINFDFDQDLSKYHTICINTNRQYNNQYENTTYYGFQQNSPIRHAIYDKVKEMCNKGKNIESLFQNYYRYELRLRSKSSVKRFLEDEKFRRKTLSEIVFIKNIPSLDDIQTRGKCTKYRAQQVLNIINGNLTLSELDKRAKKIVAEILQQLNEIELSININNLTPYFDVCKGETLKKELLPNSLLGETMVQTTNQPSGSELVETPRAQINSTNTFLLNTSTNKDCIHLITPYSLETLQIITSSRYLLSLGGEKKVHFLIYRYCNSCITFTVSYVATYHKKLLISYDDP
ncbi:hypothetical protein P6P90_09410 [Ectobacillus antri]|uniref:Uncharacterized protein n=1 Tax=Ectobacillus antri TaxID=2486280 RepID=A0ABT6H4B2_9BACI|nr:hypothetical protein [Ectobacillus antri]MDG4656916.1 hypothetical protein [Ectobacillus antri]MDG5754187.1 hypothetical protein [Ectobacillus antri]